MIPANLRLTLSLRFSGKNGGSLKKPRKISQIPARVTPAKGSTTPNIG